MSLRTTIGQHLDQPAGLFVWLNHAVVSLAVLKAVMDMDLCGKLGASPVSIAELAARCDVPVEKMQRFVRFLAAEQVLALSADGKVAATPRTQRLREWEPSIRTQSRSAETGPSLLEASRRGISAYELRFGRTFFEDLAEQL